MLLCSFKHGAISNCEDQINENAQFGILYACRKIAHL